jgi:hypothetical protein
MKERFRSWLGLTALAGAAACSGSEFKADDPNGSAGSGGVMSTGGTSSKGGSSSSSGGKSSSGGSVAVSGGTNQGGEPGVGGSPAGGAPPSGGAGSPPMAGGPSTGGMGTGGGGTISNHPLKIADLIGINALSLDGFNAVGLRCKSLTVCGVSQSCIYCSGFLGSIQSTEDTYSDGDELDQGEAVKIRIAQGAQSMCLSAPFAIDDGESITLAYNDGQMLIVYFPLFQGVELELYVADDGSTYYDAELTQLARARSF